MVEKYGIELSKGEGASDQVPKVPSTQKMVKKNENTSLRPGTWDSNLIPTLRGITSLHAPSRLKACLKLPKAAQTTLHHTAEKHIRFPASCARCLVTNTPYEPHAQDGKSWRRQQSEEKHEERTRQALSGSQEYRPYEKTDRWADRGWESTGLGEDTPMGGISEEMDLEAALWRNRQMDFDATLEQQQDLAEEHRFTMENEVRRLYGAEGLMGTREFVRHRLKEMGPYRC